MGFVEHGITINSVANESQISAHILILLPNTPFLLQFWKRGSEQEWELESEREQELIGWFQTECVDQ